MSEIDSSQILDGTIVNADISATAAIASSKLADGSIFWKRNGSQSPTANISMGGFHLNNLATPTDDGEAVRKDYVDGAITTVNATITSNQAINLQADDFIFNETPSGTVNGSNAAFTLANTPASGKIQVFKNGLLQLETDDYSISTATITFVAAPLTGSKIRVTYIKA